MSCKLSVQLFETSVSCSSPLLTQDDLMLSTNFNEGSDELIAATQSLRFVDRLPWCDWCSLLMRSQNLISVCSCLYPWLVGIQLLVTWPVVLRA